MDQIDFDRSDIISINKKLTSNNDERHAKKTNKKDICVTNDLRRKIIDQRIEIESIRKCYFRWFCFCSLIHKMISSHFSFSLFFHFHLLISIYLNKKIFKFFDQQTTETNEPSQTIGNGSLVRSRNAKMRTNKQKKMVEKKIWRRRKSWFNCARVLSMVRQID